MTHPGANQDFEYFPNRPPYPTPEELALVEDDDEAEDENAAK